MISLRSILIGLTLAATALTGASHEVTRKPNIIFILADDLGYGELGVHGETRYATPNIDRLAREGVRATNHYAGSPICAPSRAALMTGRHTGHVSVRNNFGIKADGTTMRISLSKSETTVGELLQSAGYRTALVGKWGLGEPGSGSEPWLRGFNHFYGFLNQAHAHNQYPEFLYRNTTTEAIPANFSHEEGSFANDRFTDEALGWIGQNQSQPFFLYLSYTTPHADLKVPADSIAHVKATYDWAQAADVSPLNLAFAGMMTRLDRDVGRILSKLAELGLDENTLVIFTSDNGAHEEGGKDNRFFSASRPFRGVKRSMYEGGMRVPFLARWPGQIAAGKQTDHIAAFWDFLPTAAELAGVPIPDSAIDGISYLPDLIDRPGQKTHAYLYWELMINGRGRQAARIQDWKAVRHSLEEPVELYNLQTDPGETINLAAQEPARAAQFASLFETARTVAPIFPLQLSAGNNSRN